MMAAHSPFTAAVSADFKLTDDLLDACDWLLGPEDEAAEMDDMTRTQRRKTDGGADQAFERASSAPALASVFLVAATHSPSRTSIDAPRPARASFDAPRPARPSVDLQRAALPTVPEAAADSAGVMGWLAGWGKLAQQQGCAVPAPSTATSQMQRPPVPRGSPHTSVACAPAEPALFCAQLPSPFYAASLAPAVAAPQQPRACWSSEASEAASPSPSCSQRLSQEDSASWNSWLPAQQEQCAVPTPHARASMDGWADSGAYAAAMHKRKRQVQAVGSALQLQQQQQQEQAAPRRSLHYQVRGSLDGRQSTSSSCYTAAVAFNAAGIPARCSASLDFGPRKLPAFPHPSVAPAVHATAATRLASQPSLDVADPNSCFSMEGWGAALPAVGGYAAPAADAAPGVWLSPF